MRRYCSVVGVGTAIITVAAFFVILEPAGAATDSAPLKVPFIHQETNGCGPATVKMVQAYCLAQGDSVAPTTRPDASANLLVNEEQGVLLSDMRGFWDSSGYYAFTIQGDSADLAHQISKGRVVIVALKKKGSTADLHYVVVAGLDQRRVWLNDPAKRGPGSTDRRKFEESWTRAGKWMLLAVPRVP